MRVLAAILGREDWGAIPVYMVACAGIFPFTAIPPQHGGRFFFFFNAALLMVVCRWFIMNQASVYIRYLQKLIQELCGVTGMTLES